MAITPADSAPVYTDIAGLSTLKRGAANKDPAAIREVARQFESLFTGMMLKSMRDAVGTDPIFGSDQEKMYQGMFDDQLAIQMSRGKGLGLADMLIRQLQKMGVAGAAQGAGTASQAGSADPAGPTSATSSSRGGGAAAYVATQAASPAQQQSFVNQLWPQAQQAGQQLGVDPRNLIAQAALETNWGRSLPQDASGRSSNNLFGMKAVRGWAGSTVTAPTQEYQSGVATNTTAQFRAYDSSTQSFQDYVAVLQNNPRYAAALNTGADARAFAAGLQRGGYATDPDYARKIGAIAQTLPAAPSQGAGVTDLKSEAPVPISSGTGEPGSP
jgi:flagellar protein FlgJ